jgi:hypothetical protein
MTGGVNPISNHNVDMYYPPLEARGYWEIWYQLPPYSQACSSNI